MPAHQAIFNELYCQIKKPENASSQKSRGVFLTRKRQASQFYELFNVVDEDYRVNE